MAKVKLSVKYCGKCNKTLPATEFASNRKSKDGLQKYCKSCMQSYHTGVNDEEKRKLVREVLDRLKIFREGEVNEINDTIRRIRKKSV